MKDKKELKRIDGLTCCPKCFHDNTLVVEKNINKVGTAHIRCVVCNFNYVINKVNGKNVRIFATLDDNQAFRDYTDNFALWFIKKELYEEKFKQEKEYKKKSFIFKIEF